MSIDKEREAFEAWGLEYFNYGFKVERGEDGDYLHDGTDTAWCAWQAARSLPTTPTADSGSVGAVGRRAAFLLWARDSGQWGVLPAGGYRAILQAREALLGPVADGASRRAAVAAIDAVAAHPGVGVGVEPVAWRIRDTTPVHGYPPSPWTYFEQADEPHCSWTHHEKQPLYAAPPTNQGESHE